MTNFLNKLNVLVRSSVNGFLNDVSGQEPSRPGKIPAERLGKNIDQEIAALRKRIDEAVAEEETMQNRLDGFRQQIDSLDQQADSAVTQGDDSEARRLIQQMQRQQQLAAMLQTDLEEHRQSTSDFIQRVNTLEAMVSDARQAAPSGQPGLDEPTESMTATTQPVADTSPDHTPGTVLSNLLREAREHVEQAMPPAASQPSTEDQATHIPIAIQGNTADKPNKPNPIKIETDVDDDLAKRRARLSNPE